MKSAASAPPSAARQGDGDGGADGDAGIDRVGEMDRVVLALLLLTVVLAWVSEKVWVSLSRMVVVTLVAVGAITTEAPLALVVGADSATL